MPLPSDERVIQLSKDLIAQFDTLFGQHPGFRPAHAKGVLLTGQFTPSPQAATLTRAPHALRESTPITARFSNATGLPLLPDYDPNANPRGLAIRFQLAEHVHTDIISHSTNGFPTRTGQEFLDFLRAAAAEWPVSASALPATGVSPNSPGGPGVRASEQGQPGELRERGLLQRYSLSL